jgi:hypothetical protein
MNNEQETETDGKALERVNLMLTGADSAWLDQLANDIRTATGAKVSRSEIVRAALETMREIQSSAPMGVPSLLCLSSCKSATELAERGVVTVRVAACALRDCAYTPTHRRG